MNVRSGLRLAVVLLLVGLGSWWAYRHWRASTSLEAGHRALERGELAAAGKQFEVVLSFWPAHDEASYGLGVCEQAAGRLDAALNAWARVSPSSPFAPEAAVRMAPILLERGRYARAEEILRDALGRPGSHRTEAYELLGRILRFEDRRDEARSLLKEELRTTDAPVRVLRSLWMLDFEALAVDRTRALLERAARDAPDDDRVQLGLANLSRRAGRLDEAARGLRSCLDARPDDLAAWRSWLDWAVAADRPDEARRALRRIPADHFEEVDLLALRVWFARQARDAPAESDALERLIARSPSAPGALERLAELRALDGQGDEAAALRRRKAELDVIRERYHRHFLDDAPRLASLAETLAELAEALDRPIEARGWWALHLRAHPDDKGRAAIARIDQARDRLESLEALRAELIRDEATIKIAESERPPTRPDFRDLAASVGPRFVFDHAPTPERQLPETMSGGVGLLDYDNDGWLDVYCVQGGPLVPGPDRPSPGDRLFRNRGDGTFEDATEASGIAATRRGYGHGVAVGDVDGDGFADVFVTRFGSYAYLRNRGNGTFEDATERAGLSGARGWPTSAAFADLDSDGDLDLYVCQYLRWDASRPIVCRDPETGRTTYCEPRAFEAEPDRLFRNDGGTFVDVTDQAGIVDRDGRGLGVVAVDLDDDGKLDLFVANDTTANLAFFNEGGMRFREAGLESGLAANASSGFLAGMGVAAGDLDGDGRIDLAVTNFYDESTTFYQNLGGGQFADRSAAVGTALPSRYLLGFGALFFDYDNDGRLDLATANGHVNDSRPLYPYAMPMQLLAGVAKGRLRDATPRADSPLALPRLGRGLAAGDLDNDGRLDLVVVGQGEPLAYLHNETAGGRSLTLQLEGTQSSRDPVGALVVATVGESRRTAWRVGGGSYLSASDPRIHFGLGVVDDSATAKVEVSWPSGRVARFENLPLNAGHHLREGDPAPRRLPGFSQRESPPGMSERIAPPGR